MKKNTTKKAYQTPVIRSVEFKVENGFAGSPLSLVPESNRTESVRQNDQNYSGGDYFSFGWE